MAEINQFGNTRVGGGFTPDCHRCEKELTDAIDGTLTAEEQTTFDAHIASCPECQSMLADAQRGHAWLGMLRAHRPEPPADLVGRILSRTSGLPSVELPAHPAGDSFPIAPTLVASDGRVLPQPIPFPRLADRPRSSLNSLLQTRFAMTAAMAFFSVALTLNLTGVRLTDIRARDFRPSSLRRDVYEANAHMLRYYESLRVVYELESRVRDMQHANEPQPLTQPRPTQPEGEQHQTGAPDSSAPSDTHSRSSRRDRRSPAEGQVHGPASLGPLPSNSTPGRAIPVFLPTTGPAWQKGRLA